MACLFARMTDLVNDTGVVVQIREVEGDDDGKGELFATLQIGDRTVIRGMRFLDRMADLGPRSIHVTAILAAGTTTLIFAAQYFAAYGRVVFRLHNQQLVDEPEEMSGIRRMR
ncbi:PREDICTED: LOC110766272 [Prunus dulcis]|nr:PREDICTED: LOC110766272 [Prunus dulcis]